MGAEIDRWRKPGEGDGGLAYRGGPAVRNGDATGHPGGGLRLPRQCGLLHRCAVVGPACAGQETGESADHRGLVRTGVDIQ